MPDRTSHVVESDLLIIGGGSAGMWAAKRFTELMPEKKVVIVDKGPKEWGGLMSMAGGDFDAMLPGDDLDAWVEDFIYYFDGLCDQEQIEEILRRSHDRLEDYQRYGCEFFRKKDGTLKSIPQRGLPHVKLYPAKLVGRGGEDMVRNLVRQLRKADVTSLGRIVVTDLLKKNGRVVGAVGFDSINGDFYASVHRRSLPPPAWAAGKPPTAKTPPRAKAWKCCGTQAAGSRTSSSAACGTCPATSAGKARPSSFPWAPAS